MGSLARGRIQQGRSQTESGHRRAGECGARPKIRPTEASRASQAEHLRRLKAINIYPGEPFTSADNLARQVLTSAVLDAS